jgi:hypothetical protein
MIEYGLEYGIAPASSQSEARLNFCQWNGFIHGEITETGTISHDPFP